ncbi:MAG: glycosyltransferase [Rhodospirillaceae bacterium]
MPEPPARRRLLHVFPGFDVGGVQLRIASVMNRFPDRYSHSVAAMNGRFDCLDRVDDRADVTAVELAFAKGRSADTFCRIRRHILQTQPDMLITYNWGSIEWALVNRLFTRLPHLHMESGFGPEEADCQLRRRVHLRRFALARTPQVVVPSLNLLRIARTVWKLPADRLLYVPNGVDIDKFSGPPDPSIRPAGWPADALVIGTVAPLRPEKNLPRLVRAFAEIAKSRNIRLLLVGDGPERQALEEQVRAGGIAEKVHFAGYLDAPEKAFGLMDIYALSSDTEQMPNALIQAMAAGRPVAGTDVGDVAHIVAPENRAFIAAADDAAFRVVLDRLAGDPAALPAIGRANLRRVREQFDQERMFDAYRMLFDGGRPAQPLTDLAA